MLMYPPVKSSVQTLVYAVDCDRLSCADACVTCSALNSSGFLRWLFNDALAVLKLFFLAYLIAVIKSLLCHQEPLVYS